MWICWKFQTQNLGVSFEYGLVQRILNDVQQELGNLPLPLLEFALTKLWQKLTQKQLTHNAYEKIGEISGVLTRYANEKYHQLSKQEKEQVSRIFVPLVPPGEGTEGTQRVVTEEEFQENRWKLVKNAVDARLVVTKSQREIKPIVLLSSLALLNILLLTLLFLLTAHQLQV
ncbi:MAG: hypothetical protein F6K40_20160 [Okeania sp. SIO3I5]|uniref:nSTAND1 domain-containing NTPase n=1 Tax=Okeania sp. SIO3I5 TaxID=2607805 RepID=UPI0013BAA240|nr:hypothetical protein [Okeania sp. SIO3I5]NEQ38454.1 hypothetical protein [Okeania sp. SIO3I5]